MDKKARKIKDMLLEAPHEEFSQQAPSIYELAMLRKKCNELDKSIMTSSSAGNCEKTTAYFWSNECITFSPQMHQHPNTLVLSKVSYVAEKELQGQKSGMYFVPSYKRAGTLDLPRLVQKNNHQYTFAPSKDHGTIPIEHVLRQGKSCNIDLGYIIGFTKKEGLMVPVTDFEDSMIWHTREETENTMGSIMYLSEYEKKSPIALRPASWNSAVFTNANSIESPYRVIPKELLKEINREIRR